MPPRLTTEQVIKQFKKVHGEKYDYSLVEYLCARTKVEVICPDHGVFEVQPELHKSREQGCPKCAEIRRPITKKLNASKKILEQFREIHGDKYDYSLVEYKGASSKVKIICPEHGVFEQSPNKHKRPAGCPECNGGVLLDTKKVIKQFKEAHGDWYDYSLVEYVNNKTEVKIICLEHGVYEQTPSNHKKGQGCPECNGGLLLDTKKVIKQFKNIHGDKYDYSQVNYINNITKVKIICSEHGIFEQTPKDHKNNQGCPECAKYGYKISKPAYFYIYRRSDGYLKFGITNREVKDRVRRACKDVEYEILVIKEYKNGEIPLKIETSIKKSKKITNQAQIDGYDFDGVTETLKDNAANLKWLLYQITKKR